jgi:hypothetical protein
LRTKLGSVMMQLEDEEEMELREHGDDHRRRAPHPMLTVPSCHQGAETLETYRRDPFASLMASSAGCGRWDGSATSDAASLSRTPSPESRTPGIPDFELQKWNPKVAVTVRGET